MVGVAAGYSDNCYMFASSPDFRSIQGMHAGLPWRNLMADFVVMNNMLPISAISLNLVFGDTLSAIGAH